MPDEYDIVLGEEYRDKVTGFTGIAVAQTTFLYACTRVSLQAMKDGDIKEFAFDAPQLVSTKKPQEEITSRRRGGVRPTPSRPPSAARR